MSASSFIRLRCANHPPRRPCTTEVCPGFLLLLRSHVEQRLLGANAALLLYDITNASTFEDIRGWLEGTLI